MVRDVVSVALLVGVLVVAPLGAASPYFLITPGGTYDIGSRLIVPDDQRRAMGHLAFTAVYEQEASWAEVAHAQAFGQSELVPAIAVRPPGTTQEQVTQTNKRLIDESKPVAAVVAFRAAGYTVAITGQGAEVEGIVSGLPAEGVLRVGDVIVDVDGQPIDTTNALLDSMRGRRAGDAVMLTILRDGQRQDVQVGTIPSPTPPARPVVGVTVSTYLFEVHTPFPVDIQSDNVGGPSAGFMFALGILDAITEGDLTRGYYVVGTGTIAADGTVGAVGGAAEKALAAEHDGAQLFLVPRDDYAESQRWVRHLRIEPVDRFDDAVRILCALEPLPTAATPEPPTPCG